MQVLLDGFSQNLVEVTWKRLDSGGGNLDQDPNAGII